MGFSYNKLWKLLIDNDMNKTDLKKQYQPHLLQCLDLAKMSM